MQIHVKKCENVLKNRYRVGLFVFRCFPPPLHIPAHFSQRCSTSCSRTLGQDFVLLMDTQARWRRCHLTRSAYGTGLVCHQPAASQGTTVSAYSPRALTGGPSGTSPIRQSNNKRGLVDRSPSPSGDVTATSPVLLTVCLGDSLQQTRGRSAYDALPCSSIL